MRHVKVNSIKLTRRSALALGIGATASLWMKSAPVFANTSIPKGSVIRTLLKDIDPMSLQGPILFHEHLSMKYPPNAKQHFTDDIDMMIAEVKAAHVDGVACLVDGGHADMHRDIKALRRIAKEGGVPIVASGGYYMQRTYPPEISQQSAEQIAAHLIDEAKLQRFGALGEIGQEGGTLTADEIKVFQAVALTQKKTGLPIFTHNAYTGTREVEESIPMDAALRQLDVLEKAGADPTKVAIGHMCCLDDADVVIAKQVAARGAYVGFDRVTIESIISDEKRAAMLMKLVEAGYENNILVASDFAVGRQLKSRGGPGLAQAWTVFAPLLVKAGMPETTLQKIMVDNPRRFLAFVPR